jgi:uncharacterized protein YkwD
LKEGDLPIMHFMSNRSPYRFKQPLLLAVFICSLLVIPHKVSAQSAPDAQTASRAVYLPLVANSTSSPVQAAWQLNAQEQQLDTLFRADAGQHRQNPTRNDILSQVARARAEDMANRNYFSHTNPDGHAANFLVEQAGYLLPDYYPNDGNNIESIGLNYSSAADAWQAWKDSPAHRVHVLGEESFYAEQTDYGFGYAENGNGKYWVLITAHH